MKSGIRKAGLVGAIIAIATGYGCKKEEPEKEDSSAKESVEQIEAKIAKYFPIKKKNDFSDITTPSCVHIEVLYNKSNQKNVLIVPGDTAPAWMYRDLANSLFGKGANVFSMNFYNYDQSKKVDPSIITAQTYVSNLVSVKDEIKEKYGIDNLILAGHSRGTETIQMYLENKEKPENVFLMGAVFGDEAGTCPLRLSLLIRVILNLFKKEFKFGERYHIKTYFEEGIFSKEKLHCSYENSVPLNVGLIKVPIRIKYCNYKAPHKITVITPKDDICLPSNYQTRAVEYLKNKYNFKNLEQKIVKGSHFSCVEHPDVHATLILK